MTPAKTLKLGTRRSLLAWAQSGQVARAIERLNPGVTVELVGIDTRGDKILDVPLREVAGKEFFVAELDQALASGQVDLSVHSMKDLSLDRPAAFTLAAVPKRANPRDVLLFGPGVLEKIARGQRLRIGTSSPRRVENLPGFLARALPTVAGQAPQVEMVEIRGNVNTRLSRVHEPVGSEKALDAVVLAFAGLIRLWADEPGQAALQKLFKGVRWMIMPLRECPAAPAQGALAVECRANDLPTREILARLHDPITQNNVAQERAVLAEWGGGCHQKLGATAIENAMMFVRGKKPSGEAVDEIRWDAPTVSPRGAGWDGVYWREQGSPKEKPDDTGARRPVSAGTSVFAAHSRAVPADWEKSLPGLRDARLWTSGFPSWERLARRGFWVEGCAEGFGFAAAATTLRETVLRLGSPWLVLTHEGAQAEWTAEEVLATYRVAGTYSDVSRTALREAREVFWGSGSQFDELKGNLSPEARHACGPGKTARKLRDQGIDPLVFPSVEEWRKWIQSKPRCL